MLKHYILLPNRMIAETPDFMDWAEWFESADRDVAKTETELHLISTVFIGIDYRWLGKGPPIVFETMVFTKDGDTLDDGGCWRYASWDDADTGHKAVVRRVLAMEAKAAKVIADR